MATAVNGVNTWTLVHIILLLSCYAILQHVRLAHLVITVQKAALVMRTTAYLTVIPEMGHVTACQGISDHPVKKVSMM